MRRGDKKEEAALLPLPRNIFFFQAIQTPVISAISLRDARRTT